MAAAGPSHPASDQQDLRNKGARGTGGSHAADRAACFPQRSVRSRGLPRRRSPRRAARVWNKDGGRRRDATVPQGTWLLRSTMMTPGGSDKTRCSAPVSAGPDNRMWHEGSWSWSRAPAARGPARETQHAGAGTNHLEAAALLTTIPAEPDGWRGARDDPARRRRTLGPAPLIGKTAFAIAHAAAAEPVANHQRGLAKRRDVARLTSRSRRQTLQMRAPSERILRFSPESKCPL